ncbi:MAG: KamA family radical SAM protein [Verrucomicrobiota bacterium]|nr:KamA family radical SAM protein [Verrucomicrobiota bacterium]
MKINELKKTVNLRDWHSYEWQLKHSLHSIEELSELIDYNIPATLYGTVKQYPLLVTPYYLSLAESLSENDSIIKQILPTTEEIDPHIQDTSEDPLGENPSMPVPNLIHRYPDRALIITTSSCATLCRHCMRKRLWKNKKILTKDSLQKICDYLKSNKNVREIILSGGDPLLLSNTKLKKIISAISAVDNIEIIRIGTRVPVVIPQRIDNKLCSVLNCGKPVWIATHFNHPHEISEESTKACNIILRSGIPIVNQTVLLKGINDSAKILKKLFTGLLKIKIKPYYLFHGDPVKGTMHFRTGIEKGLEIMQELLGNTSSLALPTFAIDLPNGKGKVPLLHKNQRIKKGKSEYLSYEGEYYFYK